MKENISLEEYLQIDALNGSACLAMLTCPQKARQKKSKTQSMAFGSLVHTAIMEPEEISRRYFVACDEYRRGTKKWEPIETAAAGREIIKQGSLIDAFEMRESLLRHKVAAPLMNGIVAVEQSFTGTYDDVPIKCRVDALSDGGTSILEFKTARDADPLRYCHEIYHQGHDIKAAIAMLLTGASSFFWIIVEIGSRCVSVIEAKQALIEGERRLVEAIKLYKRYKKAGHFPSYCEDELYYL